MSKNGIHKSNTKIVTSRYIFGGSVNKSWGRDGYKLHANMCVCLSSQTDTLQYYAQSLVFESVHKC
jgi:hypothetical protein